MTKFIMILALLFVGGIAHAQLYKCTINGKPLFSERPCAPNAKIIATGDGSISQERQIEAAEVASREATMARTIDNGSPGDTNHRQVREQQPQTATRDDKAAKCASLLKTARAAKNEAAMYRYHQGLIDDAKRRQKEAEDAHFSECYGSNLVPYSPPP